MVSANKILVRARKHGVSKSWIWDAKRPLRIRRPLFVELRREGNELVARDKNGAEHKLCGWGEALEVETGKGEELFLSPLSALARPDVPSVGTARTAGETTRLGFSFLASALVTALIAFTFGSTPSVERPKVTALREMKVQTLPSRITLPASVPLEFKGAAAVARPPAGGLTGIPGGTATSPENVPGRSGGAAVGKGVRGGGGTGSGTVGSRTRAKADLIREAFGNLGGSGVAGATPGIGSTGAKRTRFGFGKAGNPTSDEGGDADGDVPPSAGKAGALGSSSQVVQQLTQSYGNEITGGTGLGKGGTVSSLGKGKGGAGWAGANIEGLGYNPILLDTENLSVGEGLTHQEVHTVIQKHVSEVRRCHELASRRGLASTFQGKVQVQFRILASGSTTNASLVGAESMDSSLKSCLLGRVSAWRFSKPRGRREVDVSYPFVFMTLEGEAP